MSLIQPNTRVQFTDKDGCLTVEGVRILNGFFGRGGGFNAPTNLELEGRADETDDLVETLTGLIAYLNGQISSLNGQITTLTAQIALFETYAASVRAQKPQDTTVTDYLQAQRWR